MYDNIGGKLKGLAIAVFIIEAIAAVIIGIDLAVGDQMLFGVLILILGPIVAWISTWLLYGFGEMYDMLCDIKQNTRPATSKSQPHNQNESSKETTSSICDSNTTKKMELIACPACGRKQASTNKECWQCGAKLDIEVER